MAQQYINYGNTANDGTGDPLRDAFIKVDDNFSQIWAAGPVGSNIVIDNNTIYVTNTNGNLILMPNGVGVIQTNSKIVPSLDNTYELGTSDLRYRTLNVGTGGIINGGNLTLQNISNLKIPGGENGYVIQTDGNGVLSWVAMPGAGNGRPGGANSQVQYNSNGLFGGSVDFTYDNVAGNLLVGNLVSNVGNVITSNVYTNQLTIAPLDSAQWSIRDSVLSAPSGAFWYSNASTDDDYINSTIDGYINLRTLDAVGNLASELHLEHRVVHISIHEPDGLSEVLWEFREGGVFSAPGNITTPGNISGNYIIGNGSLLTDLPGGVIQGNVPPPSPNATTLWWDDVTGRLYVWYDDGTGLQWVDAAPAGPTVTYGNANVSMYLASGNISTNITTTGNVSGNYFVGNGSQLTGITASTGNIGFVGNAIYDLNGILLENADLSHGATAAVVLPANGDGNAIQINNTYGNIILQTGVAASITSSWTFDNTGILTAPVAVVTTPVPYANLTAVAGARAFINNGNLAAAGNFGSQVDGSGANTVPVWSDGVNWYIG